MKICMNKNEFELELYDTNFVDVWHNWIFKENDEVVITFNDDDFANRVNQVVESQNKLDDILNSVNNAITEHGLSEEWLYPRSNSFTQRFLETTHEKWANTTKQAQEKHLPIYDEQVDKTIVELQKILRNQNISYHDINHAVHMIEFKYRFFSLHWAVIQRPSNEISHYRVTHEDTSFVKDVVSLPFNDIGRPQYEKYILCGKVQHEEISNYQNITNRIELEGRAIADSIDSNYISECEKAGVPVWGTVVNIAKKKQRDPSMLGYQMLTGWKSEDGKNRLCLRK